MRKDALCLGIATTYQVHRRVLSTSMEVATHFKVVSSVSVEGEACLSDKIESCMVTRVNSQYLPTRTQKMTVDRRKVARLVL